MDTTIQIHLSQPDKLELQRAVRTAKFACQTGLIKYKSILKYITSKSLISAYHQVLTACEGSFLNIHKLLYFLNGGTVTFCECGRISCWHKDGFTGFCSKWCYYKSVHVLQDEQHRKYSLPSLIDLPFPRAYYAVMRECLSSLNKLRTNQYGIIKWLEEHGRPDVAWRYYNLPASEKNKQNIALGKYKFNNICKNCGTTIDLAKYSFQKPGYPKYCSHSCGSKSATEGKKVKHFAKYGVENPMQRKSVRAKKGKTMLSRYGVEHIALHPSFYYKKKIRLNGKYVYVQGYEEQAINYLTSVLGYCERDLQVETSQIPTFNYVHPNGLHKTYYPDIYIPRHNLFGNESKFNVVVEKCRAVKRAGYKMLLLLMVGDGSRIKLPSDWRKYEYSELKNLVL